MIKEPILSIKNLTKIYPKKETPAVDGISFELRKGEILGLLGPNGSGKTTTIQMLLGTLKPTSGSIFYFGKEFFKHRSEILQKVSFASAFANLPWNLTVQQNLNVFGRLYGLSKKEISQRMDELLERFEMTEKKKALISSLSSGQLTRVMLIKAFMVRAKIVLLDEPTASLDPDMSKQVCDYILQQREKENISILFTSHGMAEVNVLCDRVLFLKEGKIIADDHPSNLAKSVVFSTLKLSIEIGIEKAVEIAKMSNFNYSVKDNFFELKVDEIQIPKFLGHLARENIFYKQIQIKEPQLEDYFLYVTKKL
ncbi:MAG: ABC transporter ATP-binding protein [Chlamydiae bacterium]|nr:ABC transporter ATP-binding protein [Chlamydiota bacterium]